MSFGPGFMGPASWNAEPIGSGRGYVELMGSGLGPWAFYMGEPWLSLCRPFSVFAFSLIVVMGGSQ